MPHLRPASLGVDLVLPESGKTMMARRLPYLLPLLNPEEALETTKISCLAINLIILIDANKVFY
ncbi:MAG TPA: ATP-binding protein [Chthonomonadaceae bacterium]|nr:ATP-binding protein [Chthonomonadaceae bacterium]